MLSVGTDELIDSGYTVAVARVTGPILPGEQTRTLFDVSAPFTNATVSSRNERFELLDRTSDWGLVRQWWGWETFGPLGRNRSLYRSNGANRYEHSYITQLGCTRWENCASEVIDSGTPPNGTELLRGAMGVYLPTAWRRLRSYTVKLSGWFVPPFDADYRFVVNGGGLWEVSYVYLSSTYNESHKRCELTNTMLPSCWDHCSPSS